ncbi:MAG: hypothetical protein ACR2HR_15110 [Euzebya sp.]
MQVEAWDEVFIRCRRERVNGLIVDVANWSLWWPGLQLETTDWGHQLDFRTRLPLPARQRLGLQVDRVRPRDKGLEFTVSGDVVGTGEWYHLDQPAGVVVHYLLRGELTHGNARRWVAAHRHVVRVGLTALKRRLEGGRPPGAEPHPELLAHQARELAIFAEEVAAHEVKLAQTSAVNGGEG